MVACNQLRKLKRARMKAHKNKMDKQAVKFYTCPGFAVCCPPIKGTKNGKQN